MTIQARLAELLCTRLCHDITGPIGAVNNGVEFLSDDEFGMQSEAVELIAVSAREAISRIMFYRQAFGKINHHGEASLSEIKDLTRKYLGGTGRVTLDWPDSYTDAMGLSVSRRKGKLLMNLIILAIGGLIRGGTLIIRPRDEGAGKVSFEVRAEGQGVRLEEEFQAILERRIDDPAAMTPRSVQCFYTLMLADELEVGLSVRQSEGSLSLVVGELNPVGGAA